MLVPKKRCYFVDINRNVCKNGDNGNTCPYYHDVTYDRRVKKKENKRLKRQKEREDRELKLASFGHDNFNMSLCASTQGLNSVHQYGILDAESKPQKGDLNSLKGGLVSRYTRNLKEFKERERHEYLYLTESDPYIDDDPLYVNIPKLRPFDQGKRSTTLTLNHKKNFHILDVRNANDLYSAIETPDIRDVCENIYEDGIDYEFIRKAFRGMCIYNSDGGCYKGDDCPFLHSVHVVQLPCLIPDNLSEV